jgi:hypothetical protein
MSKSAVRTVALLLVLLAAAVLGAGCDCAGATPMRRDGGPIADTGQDDVGPTHPDTGAIDSSIDADRDAFVGPDASGAGLQCTACTTDADCMGHSYCVALAAGGLVCLRACDSEIADCPPRFDCVNSLLTPTPGPVCTPVGERCCVDADADDHGVGVGCRGTDCDDGSPTVFEGAAETCNNIDDDCDGAPDDGNPGAGLVCSTGMSGACSSGTTTCASGAILCSPSMASTVESCDGTDEDCDSNVDEDDAGLALTQACYDGPAGTAGIGGCTEGLRTCAGGMFRGCVGQILPGTETCNGVDDDCDSMVDDGNPGGGIACITAIPGICSAGTTQCTGGSVMCVGTILPGAMPELCDSLDNDCDGMLNEGYPGLGTACSSGLGACRRGGVTICNPASSAGPPICDAVAGMPSAMEACDYLDDDCDGTVDDGYVDGMGRYSSDANCGACGIDCTAIFGFPGSFGTCSTAGVTPRCVLGCNAGSFNLNGIPDDGCEFTLDATAVYVSGEDPGAADDSTCGLGPVATGSGRHPCRTITFGIGRATTLGRSRVLVADALYTENVALVNGISLLGGYRADIWERHLTTTLTTIRGTSGAGHRRTITATGINMTTLVEGFVIEGADASTAGANSYAIYVDGGTSALTFRSNVIYAGNGAPGSAGADGTNGMNGANGTAGLDAFATGAAPCAITRAGGAGGARTCGTTVVSGGAGGSAVCAPLYDTTVPYTPVSARAGATGMGTGGGAGGFAAWDSQLNGTAFAACNQCYIPMAGNPFTGGNAVSGANGTNGTGGVGGASTTGSIVGNDWQGVSGSAGNAGTHGGGGGGGGSGGGADGVNGCTDQVGGTGGGGGSGACGGTLGGGGGAAGGSFGIFIVNTTSRPVLTGNTIYRGFGGAGGNGGRAGSGGTAGAGANGGVVAPLYCPGDAGTGANGGNGGHGGGGGGGAGGVSYGIYAAGTTGYGAGTNTFPASGGGGSGGSGGPSIGTSGTGGATGASASTN